MIGLPSGDSYHSTPCHLSVPRQANWLEILTCSSDRILTTNRPDSRILG
jgi:hypothetical protein